MFISSDTNIWIDFYEIRRLEHPFLLEYQYYISSDAFAEEFVKSKNLREELLQAGLQLASISEEEFVDAITFQERYRKLSFHDSIALAIAKNREWVLLTGDNSLRKAAAQEDVECHGVIWVYDELLNKGKIPRSDYHEAMQALLLAVQNGKCRLPIKMLIERIEKK